MTQVKRISLAEMVETTGMPALGYSRPQDDSILLVDGLPKALEKTVLGHEYDHMSKGEEGPFSLSSALGIGGSLLGGLLGANGAKDAARTSAQGSQQAIAENSRQFDLSTLINILLNTPTINQGNTARSALSGLLGLSTPATNYANNPGFSNLSPALQNALGGIQAPASNAVDPSRLMSMIEATPGFGFAKDQAMRGIMGNNRALGLGKSGASVQQIGDTIGQGLAFPVYNSYLDRLAGLAGASSGSSQQLSSNIGNLATNSGATNAGLIQSAADSRASGTLGQSGAWQGALNNIATVAGDYFGGNRRDYFGGNRATIANPNYNWANAR